MPYQGRKLMEWDIVQRLREGRTNGSNLLWGVSDIHREAADEIERLREERDEARRGEHRENENTPTWAELTAYWKARAEELERDRVVAPHATTENERLREALEEVRPLVLGANHSKARYPKARAALGEDK